MEFFAWLEGTAPSLWVRESLIGFPLVLTVHSLAMGFLVGSNIAVALRMLGFAPVLNPALLRSLFPLMWLSFTFSLASGLLLLLAYPAKGLTNGVFYLKFLFIALALLALRRLSRRYFGTLPENASEGAPGSPSWVVAAWTSQESPRIETLPPAARALACFALLCWVGAITAGRFLAYTYSILTAG